MSEYVTVGLPLFFDIPFKFPQTIQFFIVGFEGKVVESWQYIPSQVLLTMVQLINVGEEPMQ